MLKNRSVRKAVLVLLILFSTMSIVDCNQNNVGICLLNCAQCKKMFGNYFDGPLCGESCIKFKGKLIPDCEDAVSIMPFLNKFTKEP